MPFTPNMNANVTFISPASLRLDAAVYARTSDISRDHERQLYIDRETAEADLVFWQNRQVELQRQLDEASTKIGDAWLRYDQAQNEISRLDPDYSPRR